MIDSIMILLSLTFVVAALFHLYEFLGPSEYYSGSLNWYILYLGRRNGIDIVCAIVCPLMIIAGTFKGIYQRSVEIDSIISAPQIVEGVISSVDNLLPINPIRLAWPISPPFPSFWSIIIIAAAIWGFSSIHQSLHLAKIDQ